MRDGLILHDFPFENELDEVLAYLKSLDCVYLEDLICARTLGVQPCMFLLSMAAMDFLNDLVIKLTQEYTALDHLCFRLALAVRMLADHL